MWCLILEGAVYAIFLISIGVWLAAGLTSAWTDALLLFVVPLVGMVLPLALHLGHARLGSWSQWTAIALVLAGGFLLRYALLMGARDIRQDLRQAGAEEAIPESPFSIEWPAVPGFSPEAGRQRGDPGADPGNRPPDGEVEPRSKFRR
jgi:hypothetical protein